MSMSIKPLVAVITSTCNRPANIVDRCIRSVQWQSYGIDNIIHFVCHDGAWITPFESDSDYKNITVDNTPTRTNSYGAGVRQYIIDMFVKHNPEIEYIVHLDDDNILFPDFIKEHVEILELNKDADFSICKIIHNGPLPTTLGIPPQIISGVPPVFRNIDTLQIMVRSKAMQECGWIQNTGEQGYYNDGYTYDKLGKMFCWVELPKLLAVHL